MTHTENPLSADDVFQEENSEDNVVDDARLDDDYIEDDIIQARDNGVAKRRTGRDATGRADMGSWCCARGRIVRGRRNFRRILNGN